MTEEKKTIAVLTTVNHPNSKVGDWFDITKNKTIVVGDNKTPQNWNHEKCVYYSMSDQKKSEFKISLQLPQNHYTRKNLAYLFAIKSGASRIIDTDDDNFPYIDAWKNLVSNQFDLKILKPNERIAYKNIYSYFSNIEHPFWPRGFPLDQLLNDSSTICDNDIIAVKNKQNINLWQCMVDGDPDIDAIHRLIYTKTPKFINKSALLFSENNFCAFNSQNTLWSNRKIFPLLYLPSTVSFRFTDILRGYVAQAIMHAKNIRWGFFKSSAYQERNDHNTMTDFNSEIIMYQEMNKIVNWLISSISANYTIEDNLISCYKLLEKKGIVQMNELNLLELWLRDLSTILNN